MRRLARRFFGYLFTFVAGCSALICLGVAVLWARGYFVGDKFKYIQQSQSASAHVSETQYVAASSRGRFGLAIVSARSAVVPQTRRLTWSRDRPPVPISLPSSTPWGRLGFQFIDQTVLPGNGVSWRVVSVIAPSWFAIGLSAVLPGLAYILWRRRRRTRLWAQQGHCVRCGYDLRGSAGRCPECGSETARVSSA